MRYFLIFLILFSCRSVRTESVVEKEESKVKTEDHCICSKEEIYEDGECKKIFYIDDPCRFDKDVAVCGCNGNTYSNACRAHQSGVKRYLKGSCGDKRERNY